MNLLHKKLSTKWVISNFVLVFLVLFILFNCKIDEETISHNNRLNSYSTGTNEVKVSYDIQGKPIVLGNNAINYNSGSRITIMDPYYYFTYNSLGKISTISAVANNNYNVEDASITYNSQNLIQNQSISFIHTSNPNVIIDFSRDFIYNNTEKLIEIVENYKEVNEIYSLKKQLLSYDNDGNIIKITKQISINNGKNYHNESVTTFTYDTKKNPFYNLLVDAGMINHFTLLQHFGIPTISLGYANLKLQYYSSNNLLSTKTTTHTGHVKTTNYQYQYNKNNLPISLIKTITSSKTGISRAQFSWLYEK